MIGQPEALRLADALDLVFAGFPVAKQAATELRRLYEVNQELLEVLVYFMPFIDSEQDDPRQTPWVIKAHESIKKQQEKANER